MVIDLEMVLNLHSVRFVRYKGYRYDPATRSWEHPETCEDNHASYGDFEDVKTPEKEPIDLLYIIPERMSHGDYSPGRAVEKANQRSFLASHAESSSPNAIVHLHGGHGTSAIAIKLSELTEPMLQDLICLENYPILDEQELSEVELEGQKESWDCWVKSDFIKELEATFNLEFGDLSDETVFELFETLRERSNTYWCENGCDQSIDLYRIVKSATLDDVADWPLL